MATDAQTMTAEELLELPIDRPCELLAGQLHMMTPAGYGHGEVTMSIAAAIRDHAVRNRLGTVLVGEPGFVLARDPDTVRAPDVAFISASRLPESRRGYYQGSPDLVVEVVSPGDRAGELRRKIGDWLDAGTRMVWVVRPERRSITVHRPGAKAQILGEGDTLDGGDVLPGFTCPLADIFPA